MNQPVGRSSTKPVRRLTVQSITGGTSGLALLLRMASLAFHHKISSVWTVIFVNIVQRVVRG